MDSSKCSVIPRRVLIGVMGFFGTVVIFTMRACISVAIIEMVVPLNNTSKSNESIICSADSLSVKDNAVININGTRYNWTQEQQGWIFSSFFVGYLISHYPGAVLAQKFGGKWTLSLSTLAMIVCTALTPLAVEYGELVALIVSRILIGLAAGISFPALSVLLAAWIPEKERGKLSVFALGGGQVGSLLSGYISGLILSYWPYWQMIFYFWSIPSLIWFILFNYICYNDPASDPNISKEELDYLKEEMGQIKRGNDLPPTPWKKILTSTPVIALVFAQMCGDWVYFIMSSDMPKYFKEVLGFSVSDAGIFSSLPYLFKWIISIFSGFLSDFIIKRKYVTTTQARKIYAAISSVIPGALMVAASYAGCDRDLVIIHFTLAMALQGTYYSGLRLNTLDLSPNYSGSLMALTNGCGAIAGVFAPTFAGMMTPDSSLEQWRFVFWVSFGIYAFRTIIYSIWASGKIQNWNEPRNFDTPESPKLIEIDDNSTVEDQSEDTLIPRTIDNANND